METSGDYDTGMTITNALVSPAVQLEGTDAWLEFYEFFDTEGGIDNCIVQLSTDGFETVFDLRSQASGNNGGWNFVYFDISEFIGSVIQVRFLFDTQDEWENGFAGWFIDEISIYGFDGPV